MIPKKTTLFNHGVDDLERTKVVNPMLGRALEEARSSPVLTGDARLPDLVKALGGWDDFVVWLATFTISNDPMNPPTPNPPRIALEFGLVDDAGRGTRKAFKTYKLLVQVADVLDMTL